jgi:ketosteroid isomerase-like protein
MIHEGGDTVSGKTAETTSLDSRTLGDIEAIRAVLTLYAKSLDRLDFAAMKRVFTPDATGNYHETGSYQGVDQLSGLFARVLGQCGPTQHLLGSMDIQVRGDEATASTYLQAIHIGSKPGFEGKRLTVWGEYRDQLVRTPEGWRIRHRELAPIHAEGDVGFGL